MILLERAIAIAVEGHKGQIDKAGSPYILHPLRVMLELSDVEDRIVGVLHDLVEDCDGWTFERLRGEGFSETTLAALDSVTKRADEPYDVFVSRAGANDIGRRVKIADLRDNCDLKRIVEPTSRDLERIERYHQALQALAP